MLKKRFKDEILEPADAVKNIREKARLYLFFWVPLLVISGVVYLSSTFTVVDFPTLSSISKLSPISFDLAVGLPTEIKGVLGTVSSSLGTTARLISGLVLVAGVATYIIHRSIVTAGMFFFLAFALNFTQFFFSDEQTIPKSVTEKIEFSDYVKSGDLKGYLEAIEKYSSRGRFVLNSVIESKATNQDDARNLLDVFSNADAQKVSVGLAETMENAIANGDTALNNNMPIVSALSAYVLSSVEHDDRESVIDNRTGFAIFDAAKELKGFDVSNLYSDAITAKVTSQAKIRAFLLNSSAILFALGCVFFWLWVFSFRNVHRAEKVFIEEEKLRDIR